MKVIYLVYQIVSIVLLFMLYLICLKEFGSTRNWNYPLFTLPPTIIYFIVASALRKMANDDKK
jgi:Gpi18-like mannosyltransferase